MPRLLGREVHLVVSDREPNRLSWPLLVKHGGKRIVFNVDFY